jgi:hypothetical protein
MRAAALVVLAGCLAPDATGGDGGTAGGDGGAGSVTVTITAPAQGAMIPRDYLNFDGSWVARVKLTATVAGGSVSSVEWMAGDLLRGVGMPPDYAITAAYFVDGPQTFAAVVHDSHGGVRGQAQASITITPPTADKADCPTQLGVLGVPFSAGPATMGIPNPVTVTLPWKGMSFTAGGTTTPRTSLVMDCPFALALWRLIDVLEGRHIVGIVDNGLYKYRCILGSEQPPCPSGFSPHAFGQALDILGFQLADGGALTVASDWQVDTLGSGQTTCTVAAMGTLKNEELHSLVCDMWESGALTVLLTPNYRSTQTFFYLDILNMTTLIQ